MDRGATEAVVERMDVSPLLLVGAMVMLAALDFLGSCWPRSGPRVATAILVLQAYLILTPNGSSP